MTTTKIKSETRSKQMSDRWKDPVYAARQKDILARARATAAEKRKKTKPPVVDPSKPAKKSAEDPPATPPKPTGVRYGPRRRLRRRS